MARLALLAAVLSVPGASMKCPGSPAFVHASCQVTVAFPTECVAVQGEVEARIAGENGWKDPHNGGKYSLLSSVGGLEISRVTANGKYTDKMTLGFKPKGTGCQLEACSESQVTSILDYSTNFCNVHDLYCGSGDGCPIAKLDLSGYAESFGSCRQHDKSKCVVKPQGAQFLPGTPFSSQGSCPAVATQPNFNLDSFISKRWYIQQQMPVLYLPESQNYCVYAEYSKLSKATFFGYTIQVHNYAQERDGKTHDSGNFICAKSGDPSDSAKLEVGPCFLPTVKGLITGPYWVLAYDEAAGYALISGGQPTIESSDGCRTGSGVNGAGLWIFTRAQKRNEPLIQTVRGIASSKGFDLSVLKDVDQTQCPASEEFI